MESSDAVIREAQRWFVRARAADFGAADRAGLDAWLGADPMHRDAYARVERDWRRLDALAPHLGRIARPVAVRVPRWRWLPVGGVIAAGIAAAVWLLPAAPARHFETPPGRHLDVALAGGVRLALDADSAVDVSSDRPPRIDLARGDVYVEVPSGSAGGVEVRVGAARIRDIGTRFAVAAREGGGSVAVAEGLVEVRVGASLLSIGAGRQARFDAGGRIVDQAVAEADVAPWQRGLMRFSAAPLAEVAAELARQQRIRVDLPDPGVADLRVSGSFGIDAPQQVLWAVAQVHRLRIERLGDRHFALRRG